MKRVSMRGNLSKVFSTAVRESGYHHKGSLALHKNPAINFNIFAQRNQKMLFFAPSFPTHIGSLRFHTITAGMKAQQFRFAINW